MLKVHAMVFCLYSRIPTKGKRPISEGSYRRLADGAEELPAVLIDRHANLRTEP